MTTSTTILTSLPQTAPIAVSSASQSVQSRPEQTKRDGKEIIALEQQYGIHGVPAWPIAIERASGSFMWDTDGRRYFDLMSAFSSANQGHCHPKIVEAMISQCKMSMLPGRGVHNPKYSELCEKICKVSASRREAGFAESLPVVKLRRGGGSELWFRSYRSCHQNCPQMGIRS